ncbi:MAG: hypothetical protein ACTSUK_05635 [Promethearchaeota archaeon]
MDRKKQLEIYKKIIQIPEEAVDLIHYDEDFHYFGGSYDAYGWAIVDGIKYDFIWNWENGIDEYSIEVYDDE